MASREDNIREARENQAKLNALSKKGVDLSAQELKNLKDLNKEQKERLKLLERQSELKKEIKKQVQDRLDILKQEESSIASMSGLYSNLQSSQKETLSIASSMKGLDDDKIKAISEIHRINRDISQLSKDDTEALTALTNEYNDQMGILKENLHGNTKIVQRLKAQNSLAGEYAQMSKTQKEVLEQQSALLKGISKTMKTAVETAVTLYGNVVGAIGGAITGMGFLADKVGTVNKELGTSWSNVTGIAGQTALISFFFDDAAQNARALSNELGGSNKFSMETAINMSTIAKTMGISGTEATSLLGSFRRLNGNSTGIAKDMIATSRAFAEQNNIIPAQLMGQLAASTEEFALFGDKGGENILRAAGYAAKLGVEMGTISGIADNLLDFESSITKELELGAMLGRNINLNRARALAYEGKIGEATLETLNAVGGIDAFNKMDYFAKKQTAATLGVSVAQLQKMASLQSEGVELSTITMENFDSIENAAGGLANDKLGKVMKYMGGIVTASGQMLSNWIQTNKLRGGGGLFGTRGLKNATGAGGGAPFMSAMNNQQNPFNQPGGGPDLQKTSKGASSFNAKNVLAGAAAMLIVAGSMWVLGKAVQEFAKVDWEDMGKAGTALVVLGGAMIGLSYALAPLATTGILELVALGMLVFGASLYTVGAGALLFGKGFELVSKNLIPLVGIAGGILGVAGALYTLAGSLYAVGIAGLLALPALLALKGLGFNANEVFGVGDGEDGMSLSEHNTSMINKLEEIRVAVAGGKIIKVDGDVLGKTATKGQDDTVYNTNGALE